MRRPLRFLLLSLACSTALMAQAQASPTGAFDVPAGDLSSALNTLAKQSGTNLVYRADQLKGRQTTGVKGATSTEQALETLLRGSGFKASRDAVTGAVLIVSASAAPPPPAPHPAPQQAQPAGGSAQTTPPPVTELESLQVTGSRIPRAQVEGPAPITVLTAEQIRSAGIISVPDLMRSLSQNSGSVYGQQNTTNAQSTPGSQAVDLRGLGPNHTLVLINGRRIADFPLPLNSRSNFTDIGSIPLGMIDRVEILTGSASAVYGSDAMAGVINFILKKSTDGTLIDYRYGDTEQGGGQSHRLSLTTGFERGNFSGIVGLELLDKKPLWGTDRSIQDSTQDAPTNRRRLPRLIAQLYDWDEDEGIAPDDGCKAMAGLNEGTTVLAKDRYGDPYCGSERAIAYRTIQNSRKGANLYGSFEYRFSDSLSWFADVQMGEQTVKLLTGTNGNDVTSDHMGWEFFDPKAAYFGRYPVFYNAATDRYEQWARQFSPEEIGGLENRMNTTIEKTLGLTTGFNGVFGQDWYWEAAYNHSEYKAEVRMPRILAAAANTFFLGPLQGYDDDGFAVYNADPARLFTPVTPADFAKFGVMSVWHPEAKQDNVSFTTNTTHLFSMPAGDVGFAGTVEFGSQSYRINPDPLALTADAYYGPRYGDGHGSRDHWSVAGELRMPLLESLQASLAGRYDTYSYGGQNHGKFTYNLGLEWRPVDSLLLRSSYGTGFRAPDMHYLFAGNDYYRRVSTDYVACRTDEPTFNNGDCYDDGDWDIRTIDTYTGNLNLQVETSKSFTAGFVWSPSSNFDLAVDYYKISIANQVQAQSRDLLLITEADCRLGVTVNGATVDRNSPTCVDAMARVIRDDPNDPFSDIVGVHFSPINIASEETSGIDVTANYRLHTDGAGNFNFNANYNWTHKHTRQVYPGDPIEDMLAVEFSATTLPRAKGNAGVSWDKNAWGASLFGTYLGRVANYDNDAWTTATWRFNAGLRYDISDHLRVSLTVNNLLNAMPPKDPTWANYPYYDTSWFDSMGRSYYLQFTWKLGGKAL
jgi:outer membrane receptor protein involved in Fe transport